MSSPLTREEAIELAKGPLGDVALKEVSGFVFPIFWISPEKTDPSPFSNGSMFIADFGERLFAITANHVYEGYLKDKAAFPDTQCMIAPKAFAIHPKDAIPFEPEKRLIDRC